LSEISGGVWRECIKYAELSMKKQGLPASTLKQLDWFCHEHKLFPAYPSPFQPKTPPFPSPYQGEGRVGLKLGERRGPGGFAFCIVDSHLSLIHARTV